MTDITILHTSDWHLGHHLYKRRREEEFFDFIEWLCGVISENAVDVVIVAGDIFDSATPGPGAQRMYFDFLLRMAKAGARHIIITAGNHDSPALLAASSPVLETLDIHVLASIPNNLENAIKLILDQNGNPQMLICALPYIQEKEARECLPGESPEERERNLVLGIKRHYDAVANAAQAIRTKLDRDMPIIATGHLFAAGASVSEEERGLYVGSLGAVSADIFSPIFDYVALGHIHKAQKVGKEPRIYYSGSPLALSFSEASHAKSVNLVHFHNREKTIRQINAPHFRTMQSIRGDRDAIISMIRDLAAEGRNSQKKIWLEINHDGQENPGDLRDELNNLIAGSSLEILCLKTAYQNANMPMLEFDAGLEDLKPEEIFNLLLRENPPGLGEDDIRASFHELLTFLNLPDFSERSHANN